jgi:hypothetical protein
MILLVNTSTVLLTCKILQIYFDKLKLTSHKCYDGLLNTSEASSVHYDARKMIEALLTSGVHFSVLDWRRGEGQCWAVWYLWVGGKAPDCRRGSTPVIQLHWGPKMCQAMVGTKGHVKVIETSLLPPKRLLREI